MKDLQKFEEYFLNQFISIDTDSFCLALSGGLDSIVLLHLLHDHFKDKFSIRVIHINHNLNTNSDAWSKFCKKECLKYGFEFLSKSINPKNMGFGLEANARKKRYQVFKKLLNPGECLLTAHHKTDQLETILFRMFRGTGIDGLKGIIRKDHLGQNPIFRPLLNCSQSELNEYAKVQKLEWVNDDSNNDLSFDRNYIRKSIIPVIKKRWVSVEESVHRLSSIAEENQRILNELATEDLNEVLDYDSVDLKIINHHSTPRIKNILRYLIAKNNMEIPSMHILNSGINSLFNSDNQSGEIKWSNHVIKKFNGRIYFLNMNSVMPYDSSDNISWSINQRIDLEDPVGSIEAKFTNGEGISSKKCSVNLSIKFRKGGEKILLNGSHHSKTLKNFLNEKKVLPWARDKIPLIYDNQELICVGDLWTNQNFIADSSERSFLIQWNTEMKIL